MASKFFSSTEQAFSIGFGSSMTIVTTTYRYKPAPDAPSPAKPTPAAAKPAIATSISRKRARLQHTEQATEPDDDPEATARVRAWLERAKWGHGPAS